MTDAEQLDWQWVALPRAAADRVLAGLRELAPASAAAGSLATLITGAAVALECIPVETGDLLVAKGSTLTQETGAALDAYFRARGVEPLILLLPADGTVTRVDADAAIAHLVALRHQLLKQAEPGADRLAGLPQPAPGAEG